MTDFSGFGRWCRVGIYGLGLACLSACGVWRPTVVPMPTSTVPSACAKPSDTVLVMLPGSNSRPEDFASEGFVRAAEAQGLSADLVLADAHLGYYSEHSIVDRLRADVIGPLRARGYRQIWLVGISVGAFGAMAYAQAYPADVTGIVAIGPYLGKRAMTEQIRAGGGLAAWRAPVGAVDADDVDLRLWAWLHAYASAPSTRPPLFLGFGLDDRFVADDRPLAAVLPADRVFTAAGGHDWPAWRAVWRQVLDRLPIAHACG